MADVVNQSGRKGGRGIRPWLLIPKVLAVCVYFGGVVAAWGIWNFGGYFDVDKSYPQGLWVIEVLSRLFLYVIVPALIIAILLGIALFLQHRREIARMWWWRVKMTVLVIYIPAAHLWMSSRLGLLRDAVRSEVWNDAAAEQLSRGFLLVIIGAIAIIWLGRQKPRLGQKYGGMAPRDDAQGGKS